MKKRHLNIDIVSMKRSMTKKDLKEYFKKQRVTNDMNTGTRTHKTDKYPTRQAQKNTLRKEVW